MRAKLFLVFKVSRTNCPVLRFVPNTAVDWQHCLIRVLMVPGKCHSFSLLLLDEVGYLPIDKGGADLLFHDVIILALEQGVRSRGYRTVFCAPAIDRYL